MQYRAQQEYHTQGLIDALVHAWDTRALKQTSHFPTSAIDRFVAEVHTRRAPGPSAEDQEESTFR
jgi:hypothetical protein